MENRGTTRDLPATTSATAPLLSLSFPDALEAHDPRQTAERTHRAAVAIESCRARRLINAPGQFGQIEWQASTARAAHIARSRSRRSRGAPPREQRRV